MLEIGLHHSPTLSPMGLAENLPENIVCVDCGGVCHRLALPAEDGDQPGDVIAYRCEDCLDRWDLLVEDS